MIKEQNNKVSTHSKSPLGDLGVKIAIIIATLLTLASCFDKEKYDYIPKDKKPNLRNGDTVYFVNHQDKSLVDTFVIGRYEDYNVYDKTRYVEIIRLSYSPTTNTSTDYSHFWFGINYVKSSMRITAGNKDSVNNNKEWTSYDGNGINTEMIINGTKHSVFIDSASFPTSELPNMIYYSHKEGILRYDYSDTNYYEIKK